MRNGAWVVAVLVTSVLVPGLGFADTEDVGSVIETTPPPIVTGDRVRLSAGTPDHKRWTGKVLQVTESSVLLQPDGLDAAIVRLSWPSVSDVQVSRGTYGHAKTGAIVGGLVALPIAAFLSGIRNFDCQSRCYDTTGPTVAGTLVGVGLGALIGTGVRSDRWENAPPAKLSLSVAPVSRGLGATVGLSF
jgi:hypothetical protein